MDLDKHQSEYGEPARILKDLLEMTLTNGVWGFEREVYLGQNKEKVKEMGRRLDEIGGFDLMYQTLQYTYKGDQSELDWAWDGVGKWLR